MGKRIELFHTMLARDTEDGEWHMLYARTPYEFPEGDDDRYPLAFSFRREPEKSPSLVRYDRETGQLYRRVGTLTGFNDESTERYSDRYPTRALQRSVQRRVNELTLDGVTVLGGHIGRCIDRDQMPERLDRDDIAVGFRDFDAAMAQWMFMDRHLWVAGPEPVFRVSHTNDGWKTELRQAPSGQLGRDRKHFHFGLGQYEELLGWKEKLAEMTGRPSTRDEFAAFNVYEPRMDGYRIDLEFVLDDIVERFANHGHHSNVKAVQALDLARMPHPLFDLFARTKYMRHEAYTDWSDNTAAAVVDLIDEIAAFVQENPQYAGLFAKPKENALHQEKWHARPISVMAALGFLNAPR
jgi:hypothetical protein